MVLLFFMLLAFPISGFRSFVSLAYVKIREKCVYINKALAKLLMRTACREHCYYFLFILSVGREKHRC